MWSAFNKWLQPSEDKKITPPEKKEKMEKKETKKKKPLVVKKRKIEEIEQSTPSKKPKQELTTDEELRLWMPEMCSHFETTGFILNYPDLTSVSDPLFTLNEIVQIATKERLLPPNTLDSMVGVMWNKCEAYWDIHARYLSKKIRVEQFIHTLLSSGCYRFVTKLIMQYKPPIVLYVKEVTNKLSEMITNPDQSIRNQAILVILSLVWRAQTPIAYGKGDMDILWSHPCLQEVVRDAQSFAGCVVDLLPQWSLIIRGMNTI